MNALFYNSDPSPEQLMEKVYVKGKTQNKENPIAPEFAELIIYTESKKLKTSEENFWKTALKTWNFRHINSIEEAKTLKLAKKDGSDFVRHTSNQFVRVYPHWSRQDSSNYNPIPAWAVGCQMVALNYQTTGQNTLLNKAKFRLNGNTGYILKPKFLRNISGHFNPSDPETFPKHRKYPTEFKIKIISGQQLPKDGTCDIVDPYIAVKIHGADVDQTAKNTYETKSVKNNGFCPQWDETFALS